MYRSGSSNYNSRSTYGSRGSFNTSSYGKSSLIGRNTDKSFLFSIIGLALIVVLGYVMFSLYTTYSVDIYDNRLGCFDTIKYMLGMYIPVAPPKPKPKPKPKEKPVPKPKPIPKPGEPKKEVFNIDQNIFTYKEAVAVCKAYDAELATQEQINEAYKNKANWCNFGWSKSTNPDSAPAFFITQQSYYDELQKGPLEKRDNCGKPGINGGIFSNKNIKLGANCYGVKPEADPSKITYLVDTSDTETSDNQNGNSTNNQPKIDSDNIKNKIDTYRNMIKNKKIEIRPFNRNKWSRYSIKKSRYQLSSDEEEKLIDEMRKNNDPNSHDDENKHENDSHHENHINDIDISKTNVL